MNVLVHCGVEWNKYSHGVSLGKALVPIENLAEFYHLITLSDLPDSVYNLQKIDFKVEIKLISTDESDQNISLQ